MQNVSFYKALLHTVSGLRKTEELGVGWWGRLWSPTFTMKDQGKAS